MASEQLRGGLTLSPAPRLRAEIHFRTKGLDRRRLVHLHRLAKPTATGAHLPAAVFTHLATPLLVAAGGVYLLGELLPTIFAAFISIATGTPSAAIPGGIVSGQRFAIIEDASGSMSDRQDELARQIAVLQRAGIDTESRKIDGFGVSRTDIDNSLLQAISAELVDEGSNPDTIYAFSDFRETTDDFWRSDPRGYATLRTLLEENDVQLYVYTVAILPPAKLIEVASDSGGGLIRP